LTLQKLILKGFFEKKMCFGSLIFARKSAKNINFKKSMKFIVNIVDFADDWGYSSICNQLKSKTSEGDQKPESMSKIKKFTKTLPLKRGRF
jgi:hypothetical protein